MRIIQFTPGTGSFHCGNCLRDLAMVRAMIRRGHDACLVPLYLPLMLEDSGQAPHAPLFLGGVNVYLQQKLGLFRRTPRWLDRLWDGERLLRFCSRWSDMTTAHELGEMTISMLAGEEGRQRKELDRLTRWLAEEERPDVVCLSNALLVGMARLIKQELDVPVVCTLQGEAPFLDSLPDTHRDRAWTMLAERAAELDGFIAVSGDHAERMTNRLGLAHGKVHVVHSGIELEGFTVAERPPDPPVLGYLARFCPEKGIEVLIDAFAILKSGGAHPDLRLHMAGTMPRGDRPFVERMRRRLAEHGLADAAAFFPNLSRAEKQRFLSGLTVFSVPAAFGEDFGFTIIEALASGVPVVQPDHAVYPEILAATGGGVLCRPGDPASLAEKIAGLLAHPDEARAMGLRGRRAVEESFTVDRMTDSVLAVLEDILKLTRDGPDGSNRAPASA